MSGARVRGVNLHTARDLKAALECAYPETVFAHLGIRLAWLEGLNDVSVLIHDEYGRVSRVDFSERELYSMRGGEVTDRLTRAVEWHVEPPPFYVP